MIPTAQSVVMKPDSCEFPVYTSSCLRFIVTDPGKDGRHFFGVHSIFRCTFRTIFRSVEARRSELLIHCHIYNPVLHWRNGDHARALTDWKIGQKRVATKRYTAATRRPRELPLRERVVDHLSEGGVLCCYLLWEERRTRTQRSVSKDGLRLGMVGSKAALCMVSNASGPSMRQVVVDEEV